MKEPQKNTLKDWPDKYEETRPPCVKENSKGGREWWAKAGTCRKVSQKGLKWAFRLGSW